MATFMRTKSSANTYFNADIWYFLLPILIACNSTSKSCEKPRNSMHELSKLDIGLLLIL